MKSSPGKYYDGKTALSREVSIRKEGPSLGIYDKKTHELIDRWPTSEVLPDEVHNSALFLKRLNSPARIEVFDSNFFEDHQNPFSKPAHNITRWQKSNQITFWLLLSLASLYGLYLLSPFAADFVASFVPFELEKKAAAHVKAVDDRWVCQLEETSPEQIALNKVTQRLFPIFDDDELIEIDVKILKISSVNAFASLGGKLYILSGLLNFSDSPEEFASVLAHEIEHVKNRHLVKMLARGALLSATLSSLTGDISGFLVLDPSSLFHLMTRSYDQSKELEADTKGIARLKKANIDPKHGARFFEKMKKKEIFAKNFGFLSTHPASVDRAKLFRKNSTTNNRPLLSKEEWLILKSSCAQEHIFKNFKEAMEI